MLKFEQIEYETINDQSVLSKGGLNYKEKGKAFKLEPCKIGRFGGMNETMKSLGILDMYFCLPDDFKIRLKGGFSSEYANMFSVSVDYCDQTYLSTLDPNKTCKSRELQN